MTRQEAVQAIETGIRIVRELKEKGYQILATGEMGLKYHHQQCSGSRFLTFEVEAVTGRRRLSTSGLTKKISAIHR